MTDDDPPGFVRRHRPALSVGLVVLALATLIAGTVALVGDDPERSARQPARSTTVASLSGAGAELVGLLEAGTKVAFDGSYTVSSEGGAPGTLRMWSRPPLRRVDTESGSGAELRRIAQFSLPSGTVGCVRQAVDGPWTCTSRPGLGVGAGLLPEAFVSQLPRFAVKSRVDRLGDREARCFALTGTDLPRGEVCVSPDGIPLRVQADSVRAELVQLDRSPPPDEIFELPAPLS